MAQWKLISGAYQTRSLIANAQRCVNLYPEMNAQDAPFPFTFYPTPGLKRLSAPFGGAGQGLWATIKGDLYAAAGGKLYYVDSNFNPFQIGSVTAGARVYMADNVSANAMIVVDGSQTGVIVDINTHVATQYVDPNYQGSDRIDILDGYFTFNTPGKNEIYLTNPNTSEINPLFFAGKTGGGDPVLTAICMHREQWWFGTRTTEVWDDVGNTGFPLEPVSGVFIQHGTASIHSIAVWDLNIYWLSQSPQGQGIVMKGNGYRALRISTHAIEDSIQKMGKISDAIGFTYQQEGHVYYVLTFPTGNETWVWDEATQLWHQRASIDANGNMGRIRPCAQAFCYGCNVFQDYVDGSLYTYDPMYCMDDVASGPTAIRRIRSWPHAINDGKRQQFSRFIADVQTGTAQAQFNTPGGVGNFDNSDPGIYLRWSDDRGKTWSYKSRQTFGATGQASVQVMWSRLGLSKDRVFEISWSGSNFTALNGAFVEAAPAGT